MLTRQCANVVIKVSQTRSCRCKSIYIQCHRNTYARKPWMPLGKWLEVIQSWQVKSILFQGWNDFIDVTTTTAWFLNRIFWIPFDMLFWQYNNNFLLLVLLVLLGIPYYPCYLKDGPNAIHYRNIRQKTKPNLRQVKYRVLKLDRHL